MGSLFDKDEEDDLFKSTPLQDAVFERKNEIITQKLNHVNLDTPSLRFSSFAAQQHSDNTDSLREQNDCSPLRNRTGYKTYIDNLRRDIKRAEKNRKKSLKRNKYKNSVGSKHQSHKKISVNLDDGMRNSFGELLPDGTVNIHLEEESDIDGMNGVL